MLYSQFFNFVETFDILGIQESKTDDTDNICIQGYQLFYNNREKLSLRRSGEKYLLKIIFAHYINVDDTKLSKFILWFTLSHEILNVEKDIDFGVVYITPVHMALNLLAMIHIWNYRRKF